MNAIVEQKKEHWLAQVQNEELAQDFQSLSHQISSLHKTILTLQAELVDLQEELELKDHIITSLEDDLSPNSLIPSLQEAGVVNHIHLPNFSLSSFTEVDVLENCCTVELQRSLNNGWRIIAVCPPYDKRRPDYIIARTPNKE